MSCDQIVQNEVLMALLAPTGFVLAIPVLQDKDRITQVRSDRIPAVYKRKFVLFPCGFRDIPLGTERAVRYIFDRKEIGVWAGNLQAADFFSRGEKDSASRIIRGKSVNRNRVVVEARQQGLVVTLQYPSSPLTMSYVDWPNSIRSCTLFAWSACTRNVALRSLLIRGNSASGRFVVGRTDPPCPRQTPQNRMITSAICLSLHSVLPFQPARSYRTDTLFLRTRCTAPFNIVRSTASAIAL